MCCKTFPAQKAHTVSLYAKTPESTVFPYPARAHTLPCHTPTPHPQRLLLLGIKGCQPRLELCCACQRRFLVCQRCILPCSNPLLQQREGDATRAFSWEHASEVRQATQWEDCTRYSSKPHQASAPVQSNCSHCALCTLHCIKTPARPRTSAARCASSTSAARRSRRACHSVSSRSRSAIWRTASALN